MSRNPMSYRQGFRELAELEAQSKRDQRWALAAMVCLAVAVFVGAWL